VGANVVTRGSSFYAARIEGANHLTGTATRNLAQKYGPDAIEELARLATKAESEAVRVAVHQVDV
jgi:hypothetical protein